VKTNLIHNLYCVRKYGSMPIDKFNEILSAEDMSTCKQNPRKTWYSMSLEVFTSFIFQVIIFMYYLLANFAQQILRDVCWITKVCSEYETNTMLGKSHLSKRLQLHLMQVSGNIMRKHQLIRSPVLELRLRCGFQ